MCSEQELEIFFIMKLFPFENFVMEIMPSQ